MVDVERHTPVSEPHVEGSGLKAMLPAFGNR